MSWERNREDVSASGAEDRSGTPVVVDLDERRRRSRPQRRATVTKRRIADQVAWQTKEGLRWSVTKIIRLPKIVIFEITCVWNGFTLVFYTWKNWMTCEARTKLLDEQAHFARKNGLTFNTGERRARDRDANRNMVASLVVCVSIVLALGVLTFIYGKYVAWGTLAGLIVIFDLVGHSKKNKKDTLTARPVTPLEPGVSIRKLQASIVDILLAAAPPVRLTFHGQNWLPHGVELECHSSDKITDEHLSRLERHLQAGEKMITLIRDRKNTAAPTLRLFWTDPLAGAVTPARRPPKSLTCTEPFDLTRTDDGGRGKILLLGSHILVVGRSGSGKSSGLWTILDHLVDCRDAEVDGIDLTNGPVFGAYRRVMRRVAFDATDAHVILDEAIAEALRRNTVLSDGMDADEDGLLDENWQVADKDGHRARFVIIDEYSTLAQDDALRTKAERLLEIGRKARVHLVASTPSANKRSIKSTAPINHTMLKIVFGMPFAEILNVLGPGASDEGWRPDRFEPATPDSVMDSGKAYVNSGQHGRPIVHRFDRLTPEDIRDRNRARRSYLENNIDLSPAVRLMRAAFADAGNPPQLKTETILMHQLARGLTDVALADALRPHITPRSIRLDRDTVARGYRRLDLEEYLRTLGL